MSRVLVVNDEEDLAAMCQIVLERHGHAVETRTTIADLREVIERYRPDLVVLDWIVGDQTADRALLEFRKDGGAGFPILVISGTPSVKETARHLGAASFISKPFGAMELVEEVERLLDGGGPAPT